MIFVRKIHLKLLRDLKNISLSSLITFMNFHQWFRHSYIKKYVWNFQENRKTQKLIQACKFFTPNVKFWTYPSKLLLYIHEIVHKFVLLLHDIPHSLFVHILSSNSMISSKCFEYVTPSLYYRKLFRFIDIRWPHL